MTHRIASPTGRTALRLAHRTALAALAVVALPLAQAADSEPTWRPPARAAAPAAAPAPAVAVDVNAELASARAAIQAQNWAAAIEALRAAERKTTGNADVYNLLGYATRKGGDVPAGLAHYATALRLDPNHRGALEYQGEGFLQQGQPERAQANLARLQAVCGGTGCEEYQGLAQAIAAHQRGEAPAGGVKARYNR